MKHPKLKILVISSFLLIATTTGLSLLHKDSISALDNDFSNGITVDSTLDTSDFDLGDTSCDDGAGHCTLRAAIEVANSDPDASTILFDIQEPADFTNNSQDGYTIKPQSTLPDIAEQTTIDGYSQPGSQANTAVAPNPLNGTLLIEVDGSEAGSSIQAFLIRADHTELKGLVVSDFNGSATLLMADDVIIRGCYLGTDPEGSLAKPNVAGVNTNSGPERGTNALIGGLNPEDRNIISGNTDGGGNASGGYPGSGWVFKGNYIGIGADGLTAIPNSSIGGSGGLSIDEAEGTVVGGPESTAINVIAGNLSHGLAPDNTEDLLIEGNYIGVGYDGTTAIGNGTSSGGAGLILGNSTDAVIKNNIISNNNGGVYITGSSNVLIQGNTIHSSATTEGVDIVDTSSNVTSLGNSIYDNDKIGINLADQNGNSHGVTLNDPLDSDAGANDLLNFPLYTNVQEASGNTTVDYLLDVPAGDYRIEFFSNTAPDPSGYGEGEEYLGFQNVTSTGSGEQAFSHTLTGTTGVTNLALTTTEIDESADGFGATSEFGREASPPTDISITIALTNPQDISIGATANYQITYTNSGPEDADLSEFGGVLTTQALFYDFIPPDIINPSGYISDGPLPDTYFLSPDNPDLTCLYGPGPIAYYFGLTNDATLGVVACWLTGPDTTLESGASISTNLSFEVAPDSDLVFTSYAVATPTAGDPDFDSTSSALSSGDAISYLTALETPPNNFASAPFPLPANPEEDGGGGGPSPNSGSALGSTGNNALILMALASMLTLMPASVLVVKRLRV